MGRRVRESLAPKSSRASVNDANAQVMQGFLVATVLLGIALLLLLFSNVVRPIPSSTLYASELTAREQALLAIYPPSSHRPLDTGLIHAPLRLYLILPLMLLFPQALLSVPILRPSPFTTP